MLTFLLGTLGPWQLGIIFVIFVIPLIVIIDVLRHSFVDNEKLIWVLVVLFMPIVGSLLYLALGRKRRKK